MVQSQAGQGRAGQGRAGQGGTGHNQDMARAIHSMPIAKDKHKASKRAHSGEMQTIPEGEWKPGVMRMPSSTALYRKMRSPPVR